jgi:superfamily II DNA helicase RecQ
MSKSTEQPNEEKKSCRDCAYQHFGFFAINRNLNKWWTCRFDKSSIKENELDIKSCENYIRKKKGMTLQQQIEEHKQEQKRREELAEQVRITKEHNKLSNRLKRNWYYVSALIIALIGLTITIWKLVLGK